MADVLDELQRPRIAEELARFGKEAGANGASRAATINYNVPLPGMYSWDRLVPLGLPADWFEAASGNAGTSLTDLGVVEVGPQQEVRRVNGERLAELYRRMLPPTAQPSIEMATPRPEEVVDPEPVERGEAMRARMAGPGSVVREAALLRLREREGVLTGIARAQETVQDAGLLGRRVTLVAPGLGQSVREVDYDMTQAGKPRLALLETWELRSFLGDYGLGRTLQTYTLLPGERTTITIETWRTDTQERANSTSIFDSSDTSAQSRFSNALTNQSGAAFQDQGGWSSSVGVKADVWANFVVVGGEVSVEAGFAANHQEARQTFATSTSNTAEEHAAQVNNSRRQAVQASSSSSTAQGSATTTLREIANTNLRRVLNFVFRELNQTYDTFTVLRNVRVAFYNGNVGSAEIVPLSGIRTLLSKHIVAAHREEVARTLLAMAAECNDVGGTPTTTLQVGRRPEGHRYQWEDIGFRPDGTLNFDDDPLDARYSWRFKPGMLGTIDGEEENGRALGVITGGRTVVLRTDNVVVEALLGQADALDPYASALQALDLQSRAADIAWRKVDTRKTTRALDLVAAAAAGEDQVDAFTRMLGDKPDIQVVPAAAVSNGPGD